MRTCIIGVLLSIAFTPVTAQAGKVRTGIEVLLADNAMLLRGKRVALITHPAGVTAELESTADALFRIPGVTLVALMGPEHGIRGAAYAGESVVDDRDSKTKLPVYSLFGKDSKPTPEMLKGVDMIVYDLQDIGVRSYTYVTTLALVMEAAADAGIPVIVLDRPAPMGGLRVDGNVPPADWAKSFVCWLRVPYVYGMTPGEMARMINGENWLPGGKHADLTVVPLEGWKRGMSFADTGLPWVLTSPHIPHEETAYFYPMTGLAAPSLNNGVGYTLPFELIGAPWIDGDRLAAKLNELALPGLHFRQIGFKPFYGAHKGIACQGIQVHITDHASAPMFPISFYVLEALNQLYPERRILEEPPLPPDLRSFWKRLFTKRPKPASAWKDWEDAACDPAIRRQLANGRSVREMAEEWRRDDDLFLITRKKYLLYR